MQQLDKVAKKFTFGNVTKEFFLAFVDKLFPGGTK